MAEKRRQNSNPRCKTGIFLKIPGYRHRRRRNSKKVVISSIEQARGVITSMKTFFISRDLCLQLCVASVFRSIYMASKAEHSAYF